MGHRSTRVLLALTATSGAAAAAAGILWRDPDAVTPWFERSVFHFLALTVALLGVALHESRRVWARFDRATAWQLGLGLGLTVLAFVAVGTDWRILADETNLSATSLSLYLNQRFFNITEGTRYFGYFHVVAGGTPSRPGFFPFLVSILHLVRGFHPENAFVVNFGACAALLGLVAKLGNETGGARFGALAAVLTAAFPLHALCATSGGFETINVVFVLWVALLLLRFLRDATASRLELMCLVALLGAQCRYESAVLLGVPLVAFALRARTLLGGGGFSWRLPVMPLLALPILWHRFALHELPHRGQAGLDEHAPFGIEHLGRNLGHTVEFLFDPRVSYPSSPGIAVLAVAGAGVLVHRIVRVRRSPAVLPFAGIVLLVLGALFAAHMTFALGDFRTAFNARIALVYVPVLALLAAGALDRLAASPRLRPLCTVVALGLLLFGTARAAHNERGKALTLFREHKRVLEILRPFPKESVAVISDVPGLYVGQGYGAVGFGSLDEMAQSFQRHLFTDVLVIQHVAYTGAMTPTVAPMYELEPIGQFQNEGVEYVRVARLRGLR